MKIFVTAEFESRYRELPSDIQKKTEKQEKLFRKNVFHPSLRTEKLEPKHQELWSFRIDKKYRVLFRFINNDSVLFLTVGTHDWIYSALF